ncbi:biotin/lipoyl-binding protein [Ktedonosporobacter rubrisoli]|uniref:Biotin carboxyl carrier protein of acetyl-CoA carboxylase n=1 Tax=Ktedonosporobacter rubrisoli TaxID=2509675 RepID=A0A4P6JSY5_KTERU|nr:biotin/lipoyl-containing protein [Ktedonosporobacter rubrisoli]QBD78405.1 biotin/lipoyl-binding protein [Ktedonosporobacter rubrisoli]
MDGNMHHSNNVASVSTEKHGVAQQVSIEQLRHLIRLLDSSDVSEIEVRRITEGTQLILRKAKAPESSEFQVLASPAAGAEAAQPAEAKQTITAPLVGIFHSWAKPKGKPLVAVGDTIKVGQLVGTIQSLNVINEVEALVAGRIVEIHVQDGQAVEYGQQLMTIEPVEEA